MVVRDLVEEKGRKKRVGKGRKKGGEIDTEFIIGCTPTEGLGLHRMQQLPSKRPWWLSSEH